MAGGSLHDTWDTRGDLPVRRPECCEPGCRERPTYRDDDTGEPICGPHLRERRREARGDAAPPSPPPEDTTMPAPGTRTAPPCARPGCGRKNLAHGLCDVCRSRARARDLPVNRPLTADELDLLDLPAPEALAKQGKKKERASPTKKPAPTTAEAAPVAPVLVGPDSREFWKAEAEGLQKRIDDVNAALEEANVDPENEREEGDAVRELVRLRDAARARAGRYSLHLDDIRNDLADAGIAVPSDDDQETTPRRMVRALIEARDHERTMREHRDAEAAALASLHSAAVDERDEIRAAAADAHGRQLAIDALNNAGDEVAPDGRPWSALSTNELLGGLAATVTGFSLRLAERPPETDAGGATAVACRRDLFRALGGDEEEDVPSWPALIRDVEELVAAQDEDPEALAERAAEAYERQARAMEQRAAALRAFARGEVAGA